MKAFVFHDLDFDVYEGGLAVVIAETQEQAIEILKNSPGTNPFRPDITLGKQYPEEWKDMSIEAFDIDKPRLIAMHEGCDG